MQRRHLARNGVACAWCTLAALAGCLAYDAGGRAASACSAMRGPVSALADSVVFGHPRLSTFSVGVFTASPMVDLPDPFGRAQAPEILAHPRAQMRREHDFVTRSKTASWP